MAFRGGRGGGRGRGAPGAKSFSREQLTALGAASGNDAPTPVTQPPTLFPLLDKRPVPLIQSMEMDYLLILRQEFIDHMQLSGAYLRMPENKNMHPEQEIDRLVAQITTAKEKFDWALFPSELRPKMLAKRAQKNASKEVNVEQRLSLLEKLEQKVKEELPNVGENEDELEDLDIPDDDEEMDDGTDYANNYFDNGEDYEEEDDNLEDGPIF